MNKIQIYGIQKGPRIWARDGTGSTIWSFDRDSLEFMAEGRDGHKVEPMADMMVATIPEAAQALLHALAIQKARQTE